MDEKREKYKIGKIIKKRKKKSGNHSKIKQAKHNKMANFSFAPPTHTTHLVFGSPASKYYSVTVSGNEWYVSFFSSVLFSRQQREI